MTIKITNKDYQSTYSIYGNSTLELSLDSNFFNAIQNNANECNVFYIKDTFQVMNPSTTDDPEEEITYTYYKKELYFKLIKDTTNKFIILATLSSRDIKPTEEDSEYTLLDSQIIKDESMNLVSTEVIQILLYFNFNNIKIKYKQNSTEKEFESDVNLLDKDDRLTNYNFFSFNNAILFNTNNTDYSVNLYCLHQWFNTSVDTFNSNLTLEPYAYKQLPFQDLSCWFPLYNDFEDVINKDNILNSTYVNSYINHYSFLNNYLEFNPNQTQYKFPTNTTALCNVSFWFKLDTDYIYWVAENKDNNPNLPEIELFTYANGYKDIYGRPFRVTLYYKSLDENNNNLIIRDTLNNVYKEIPLNLKKWYFINFSTEKSTLYITILQEELSKAEINLDENTLAFDIKDITSKTSGEILFGSQSLFSAQSLHLYNGNILSISDLLIFENHNFYIGNNSLNNIDGIDRKYNLYMLYLLNRGTFSEQKSMISNYLIHNNLIASIKRGDIILPYLSNTTISSLDIPSGYELTLEFNPDNSRNITIEQFQDTNQKHADLRFQISGKDNANHNISDYIAFPYGNGLIDPVIITSKKYNIFSFSWYLGTDPNDVMGFNFQNDIYRLVLHLVDNKE